MRQTDQVRFQYDRKFTQRLTFVGIARYESQDAPSGLNNDDEDTARLDLSLRWLFTPTWFVRGGYAYIWQKEGSQDGAYNNRFYLGVAYKGLGRKR
jgi:long-subunit fatty acid transport protein